MPTVDAAGVLTQPTWVVVVLMAFVAVGCVLACLRRGLEQRGDMLMPVGLALLALVGASLLVDLGSGRDDAPRQHSLEMRVLELTAHATMPGSALACLNAMAGDTVEASCEKALFATPEATAAAVSYVAAQLSLFAIGAEQGASQNEHALAGLRRALEADRFGLVAHVLSVRHDCTAQRCEALALFRDASRVGANLAAATYDGNVERHMAAWPSTTRSTAAVAKDPAPAPEPPTQAAPVASAKPSNNLFFPSAASIPPVNIMTAEPSAPPAPPPQTRDAVEAKPAAARRQQQARPAPAPAARTGEPMQIGPNSQ